MDVKTVCLGMLTDGPASGYDLKKQFESSFGHFFATGYGSIYPALSALAEQGHVDCEHVLQQGKPDRKVYKITGDGVKFLLKALENPAPCHKVRSEFLATMCFAHLMADDQIETVINSRLKDNEKYLKLFSEFESDCMQDWPPGMQFVVGFGRAVTEAMRKYVEENRHKLLAENSKPEVLEKLL